jgi:DNA-binding YbaB/EbfC family protein
VERLDEEIAVFDGGGAGGFDMSNLLAQAQEMQNQLMAAQADLESQEIEGSAGGGLVTALVSGTGELLSLNIKPEAVDPGDTETLADLIVAAVRDASENAKQAATAAMGPLAGGLPGFGGGPDVPDFGGSSAPAGFAIPGTTTPAVGTGDAPTPTQDPKPGEPTGPSGDNPTNSTTTTTDGATSTTGVTSADSGSSAGGVGFVNPGSGAGLSGQNPG